MIALNRADLLTSMRRIEARVRSEPKAVYGALRPAFQKWGVNWEKGVQSRFEGGGLNSRTGALKRSMRSNVVGSNLDSLTLRMESIGDLAHAKSQEFGGVIRPKNSKYLTIPTSFNKTAAGVTDFPSARALIAAHPDDTFFRRTGKGRLFLFWKDPSKKAVVSRTRKFSDIRAGGVAKGAAVPMFQLVKSVDLPGPRSVKHKRASRLGFYDTWNAQKTSRAADLVRIGLGGGAA